MSRQIESLKKSGNFERILASAAKRVQADAAPPRGAEIPAMPKFEAEAVADGFLKAGVPEIIDPKGPSAGLEAIILAEMRPAYFITNDEIQVVGDYDHVDLIRNRKVLLEASARNVGRVDLLYHPTQEFVGTGWLIEKDIVVTNRHVAEFFTDIDRNGGYRFKDGVGSDRLAVMMDYVRQYQSGIAPRRAFAGEVLYIAGQNEPDFAFLKVEQLAAAEPMQLETGRAALNQPVAAIGYPAWDGNRNDPQLMASLFGGVYNVKRFSPGLITGSDEGGVILQADYTSLGGNSGSAVIDLDTGKVVALHFGGLFRQTNSAVAVDIVASALRRMKSLVPVELPAGMPVAEIATASSPASGFAGRKGYDPAFLGNDGLSVPLPGLGAWRDDIAPVSDDQNSILKYQHFSTVQSKSRRLPLLTAVNIDGEHQRKLGRDGTWKLDGRIASEHQVDNVLYRNNRLDRGHMVRRRDPGWGEDGIASSGEADTFHYTNCVPQHEDLNQKTWVRLEDYLLLSAETKGFKASIFTGPVFRSTDKRLKSQPGAEDIQIPEEFWKVAVMINADTGRLHATAYVLSHGPLIRDMTESAFVYGQHETYQVRVDFVEKATGLDFGALRTFDPLAGDGKTEAFGVAVRLISHFEDLKLS